MYDTPDEERAASMLNTVQAFGPIWFAQGCDNMAEIVRRPSVAMLADKFRGKPGIIIAPGPSLSRNVGQLQALKGRALLMTYSRALHALAAADVVPDTVTVLDPLDLLYHFDGYDTSALECLILGMTCNPKHYRLAHKRIATFSGNAGIEGWIWAPMGDGETVALNTSCSVATTTTSLAILLGCDPIIYVGQDLALTDGQYWATGTSDGAARIEAPPQMSDADKQQRAVTRSTLEALAAVGIQGAGQQLAVMRMEDDYHDHGAQVCGLSANGCGVEASGKAVLSRIGHLIDVPAYDGNGTVKTTPSFSWVGGWIEDRVRENPDRHWYNCTEGGRHLAGMEHRPLADVIAELPREPIAIGRAFDEAIKATDAPARKRAAIKALTGYRSQITLADRIARRLFAAARNGGSRRAMDRDQLSLEAAIAPISVIVSTLKQQDIGQVHARAQQSARLPGIDEAVLGMCETVMQACGEMVPALDTALASLGA
jgi:hypothetical protein